MVSHLLYVNCWVVMNAVPTGSSGLCPGRGSVGPGNALSVLVSLGPWATWDSQSNKVTSYRGFGHAVSSPSSEGGGETEGWTGGWSTVSRGRTRQKLHTELALGGSFLVGCVCHTSLRVGLALSVVPPGEDTGALCTELPWALPHAPLSLADFELCPFATTLSMDPPGGKESF